MEDRAKELCNKLGELKNLAILQLDENRDVIELIDSVVSELDPPEYPCNGELVEAISDCGYTSIGYADKTGIQDCKNNPYAGGGHLHWGDIKDYRVIREAKDIVTHPSKWRIGDDFIFIKLCRKDGFVYQEIKLTRAEAEEIHRELK